MLSLPPAVRVFLASAPVDGRLGIDGLAGFVREHFGEDPLSGHLFVFRNRRGDRARILYWDRSGYWLLQKRLERGVFRFPLDPSRGGRDGARVEVESADLALLLEGIDLAGARRRPRFVRETTREGRIWIYVGGAVERFIVYEYTPTREGKWPQQWLAGWRGYLHADAYGGLDGLYESGAIVEVGCWAHARRKFFAARKSDRTRANWILDAIGRLYKIERDAHGLAPEERQRVRTARAGPIQGEIHAWLARERTIVLPKSPMGLAIQYAWNQWTALTRYVEDGALEIDNNRSERGLRRIAVGRKNWIFAGSDEGGRSAATIYSVLATCAEHAVEPWAYLTDVLERLPTFRGDLAALAPHAWRRRTGTPDSASRT